MSLDSGVCLILYLIRDIFNRTEQIHILQMLLSLKGFAASDFVNNFYVHFIRNREVSRYV